MPQTAKNTPGRRALVVEDESDIAGLLQLHLGDLCDEVVVCGDGRDGLVKALAGRWDLVVLDLGLPGVDGLEICRRIRQRPDYTPILMVTAKSAELDRVVGLETGADDYLTKPFSVLELVARARAIFRRADALAGARDEIAVTLNVGTLSLDPASRTVTLDGRNIELTAREFDLLHHFMRNPGKVFTRTQLLDSVWGYGHDGYEHTVNSHINRLRAKIEPDHSNPRYVVTVWGVGYKLGSPE